MTFSPWPAVAEAQREAHALWVGRLATCLPDASGPFALAHVQALAEGLGAAIQALGGTATAWAGAEALGHPCVLGHFPSDPAHPTALVHLAPFAEELSGGPSGALGALVGGLLAIHALRQQGVPLNLKLLVDLGEALGSDRLAEALAAQAEALACDQVLVLCGPSAPTEAPVLVGGIQGHLGLAFRLRTAERAASAALAAGYARNPLMELGELLAACVDGRSGKVRIPGFYDEVQPLHPREVEGFAACAFDAKAFNAAQGLKSGRTSNPALALSRLWALPTMEVLGFSVGEPGPLAQATVPDAAELRVACRLVAGMGVERTFSLVRDFVRARHPEVSVDFLGGLPALQATLDGPQADAAIAAVEAAHGQAPVFVRQGLCRPGLVALAQQTKAPLVLMPFAQGSPGAEGPEPAWAQARRGIVACAAYLQQVAHLKPGPGPLDAGDIESIRVTIAQAPAQAFVPQPLLRLGH